MCSSHVLSGKKASSTHHLLLVRAICAFAGFLWDFYPGTAEKESLPPPAHNIGTLLNFSLTFFSHSLSASCCTRCEAGETFSGLILGVFGLSLLLSSDSAGEEINIEKLGFREWREGKQQLVLHVYYSNVYLVKNCCLSRLFSLPFWIINCTRKVEFSPLIILYSFHAPGKVFCWFFTGYDEDQLYLASFCSSECALLKRTKSTFLFVLFRKFLSVVCIIQPDNDPVMLCGNVPKTQLAVALCGTCHAWPRPSNDPSSSRGTLTEIVVEKSQSTFFHFPSGTKHTLLLHTSPEQISALLQWFSIFL